MKRLSIALFAFAFAGIGGAAVSVRNMTLAELVRAADCVVLADVESARSEWSADGKTIYTLVTLAVRECWKGSPVERVVVRVPGGQIGAVKLHVSEAATFVVGERTTTFLRAVPQPGGTTVIETVGWFRGKLSVAGDTVREMKGKTVAALRGEVAELVRLGR